MCPTLLIALTIVLPPMPTPPTGALTPPSSMVHVMATMTLCLYMSRFWVEKGAWKHHEKYVVFFS